MLFDIGANLTHSDFKDDLQAVLDRAKTAGVLQMAVTGASLEGSKQAVALSEQFEEPLRNGWRSPASCRGD